MPRFEGAIRDFSQAVDYPPVAQASKSAPRAATPGAVRWAEPTRRPLERLFIPNAEVGLAMGTARGPLARFGVVPRRREARTHGGVLFVRTAGTGGRAPKAGRRPARRGQLGRHPFQLRNSGSYQANMRPQLIFVQLKLSPFQFQLLTNRKQKATTAAGRAGFRNGARVLSSLRDWPPCAAPVTKNVMCPFKSAGKPDALQTQSRPPERLAHAERLECGEALCSRFQCHFAGMLC